jgi:hypothetical protein
MGREFANAFGVYPELELANAFGVTVDKHSDLIYIQP